MELVLTRKWFSPKTTIGELAIDGKFECFTLEDVVREDPNPATPQNEAKVKGETAIPEGRYEVVIDFSPKFGKPMPHVLTVPGFEGIRIHTGNFAEDTEGCLLLGLIRRKDAIGDSRNAFERFLPKLRTGLAEGKVFITVTHAPIGD